jgi:hypothetical protein
MKKLRSILLIAAGLLLVVNVILTSLLISKPAVECQCSVRKPLPCESVPISWAVDNYDCANSLLLAMNVTNVKFRPKNSTNSLIEEAIARLKNRSYSD